MLESLTDLVSGSTWTYAFIFLVAALDAFFPVVPSETMVVAGGVLAANGDLELGFLIPAAAAGAIVGDHISYTLGRTIGERITDRVFHGKRKRHLERAGRMLDERGGYLIVIGRFIPGGRTATTFSAGTLEMPLRRFFPWDVLAGFIWAVYASLIGFFGGKAFEDDPTRGILLALGIAFAIAAGVEITRWWRKRARAADDEGKDAADPAPGS
jgi:membrane-associated protein